MMKNKHSLVFPTWNTQVKSLLKCRLLKNNAWMCIYKRASLYSLNPICWILEFIGHLGLSKLTQ